MTLACKEAIAEQGMHVASLIGQEGGMQPAVTVDTMSKVLEMRHFEAAMKQTRPSVSEKVSLDRAYLIAIPTLTSCPCFVDRKATALLVYPDTLLLATQTSQYDHQVF